MKTSFAILSLLAIAGASYAQVDGTLKPAYGTVPLAVQDTQTQFGDSNNGGGGSELDAVYAYRTWDAIHILFTGNVEPNGNFLNLMFDGAGGQNRLLAGQAKVGFNKFNNMADDGSGNGLTFDAGFNAAYMIGSNNTGNNSGTMYTDYAVVGNSTLVVGSNKAEDRGGAYLGSYNNAPQSDFGYGDFGFRFAINNTNNGGVTGGTALLDAAGIAAAKAVTTGVEYVIPNGLVGNAGAAVNVCAFINGGNMDYISNQVLGGIGGGSNFGNPRSVNFASVPGNQYFTIPAYTGGKIISGTLKFNNGSAEPALVYADVRAADNTTVLARVVLPVKADGTWSLIAPGTGTYNISIKLAKYLRQTKKVVVSANGATGVDFNLLVGDADNNGTININDYAFLSDNFNTTNDTTMAHDPTWWDVQSGATLARYQADFDGNGAININDYAYLSDNFNLVDDL